ncbi:serine-tRNA(Ala) deacylase [Deinococcus irradiatisoli]|uniref:Serine-tRNA(Ala) deacylase n=1 Tax=Deinococcus irradiatisoli TaxID=2202254 RepID=A0A2Z3JIZ4_9DEIO|nr:alanyl-tRNA editing protein [Deinococcus irradiatisoli]AWN23571.1 serine-tRNA(Ala) deacylase [Deinococcus irradiatisoli]
MTQLLYYQDPEQLNFSAAVTRVDGQRVALSATAFYPEGGGQNADVGRLSWSGGEAQVTDTQKNKASGELWHTLSGAVPGVGDEVQGEVDAAHRWRTMQRHSGEHLLAQAFFRLNPAFAVAAVGMRSAECTLDLQGQPAETDVRAAETLLRETLGRRRLKLRTVEVPEAELERYPLRRSTKITGTVRLVIFEDEHGFFDVSACGGVHVPWAAMAGPVTVLRTERIKGGLTRVVFMAGEEAGERLSSSYQAGRTLAATFSAGPDDLTARVEALRRTAQDQALQLAEAQRVLLTNEIAAAPAEPFGDVRLRQLDVKDAALLPTALSVTPPGEVLLVTAPGGRVGIGSTFSVHAGEVLRSALGVAGGKGGGKPEAAQGQTPDVDGFAAAVRAALSERQVSA